MSRFEKKKDFIVSIAFLRLKNTIATKNSFWLPRGNMSISQETNPQNPLTRPTDALGIKGVVSTHSQYIMNLINPLLVITGSEIACVRVVVKCGVL